MQRGDLTAQLSSCASSYCDITRYFATQHSTKKYNYPTPSHTHSSSDVESFLDARISILTALASLNFLLNDMCVSDGVSGGVTSEGHMSSNECVSDAVSGGHDIYIVGRMCLAPRLCDGILDVCVITSVVVDECGSSSSGVNSSNSGDRVSDRVSEVVIHWVYPRNIYELRSAGIRVSVASECVSERVSERVSGGLVLYTQEMHTERITALQALQQSDRVLVNPHSLTHSLTDLLTY